MHIMAGDTPLKRIRIAEQAPEVIRYAARETQRCLAAVTGEFFPIEKGGARIEPGDIFLARFDETAGDWDAPEGRGEDDIAVRVEDGAATLAGRTDRAVMYAAFDFLREEAGCRFLHPEEEVLPALTQPLSLAPGLRRFHPPLEYREDFFRGNTDVAWKVKNKLNGHFDAIPEEMGGYCLYEPFVHSFDEFVPAEKHFDAHPEWFSEADGKRVRVNTQLCLSSEDVYRETIREIRARLRANPAIRIVSVSQNDCQNPCRCDACQRVYEEEGSYSGSILRFVNHVARELEDEFPNVAFDTLAYQYSRRPPKRERPRHNVIVRLCDIENCFAHPLEECGWEGGGVLLEKQETSFYRDITDWSRICDRLYIWDYVTNFAHYIQPFPNLAVLRPNMRFFVAHGVKGVFSEGNNADGASAGLDALRQYLLARLLWNPDTDTARDTDDFLRGYYRAAAPYVAEYVEYLHARVRNTGAHMGIYDKPSAPYLTDETMRRALEILRAAEKAVESDGIARKRVRWLALSPRYVMLRHRSAKEPGFAGDVDAFLAEARALDIREMTEWRGLEYTRESFMKQE